MVKISFSWAVFFFFAGFGLQGWSSPSFVTGKSLYANQCAECHGERGQGVEDEYSKPLVGDWPLEKIIRYVDKTMPDYDPKLIQGKDAELVSKFIFESFYQKPELYQKDSKVQLSRLTNRQFRQSLADLFSHFEGQPKIQNRVHGLRGKYYNAKGMNKKKTIKLEQIDGKIDFNFKDQAPIQGMDVNKFSIYWEGSLKPRETGWYEFFVQSPNGFSLRVNQNDGLPTIDEKVTAGMMREVSAKLFLLGGRPYPLSLEYFKFDDPNASIELKWKTPVGEKEIIPKEFLFSEKVSSSFVTQQNLPPDDYSQGFERGIQIDDTWDEAVTFAVLEAAEHAAEKVSRLIRGRENDPDQREKVVAIAEDFVRLAFREKLSHEELEWIVHRKFNPETPLQTSIEKVILFTLKSPRFLYPEWQALAKDTKDSFVVASRLALYLWDSVPDMKMHDLIDRGQFVKELQIENQAKQMTMDPRAHAKFHDFLLHWLEMNAEELPTKSTQKYPDFSSFLALDLRRSLFRTIEKIVWEKKGHFEDFLRMENFESNRAIAEYYGMQFPKEKKATDFVTFHSSKIKRQGLHTHPYLLASHSYAEESSPIHRGVFVSRKILGRTLRPPKEAVSFSNSDFDPSWTMRQKVSTLTKPANCMSCHDLINSTGFSLEGFDAVGKTREEMNGKPINLGVKFMDEEGNEKQFHGPSYLLDQALKSTKPSESFLEELFKHLAKQPAQSYSRIEIAKLSKMIFQRKINLSELYMKLCFLASTEGFSFQR
jgi:hypothetical protein